MRRSQLLASLRTQMTWRIGRGPINAVDGIMAATGVLSTLHPLRVGTRIAAVIGTLDGGVPCAQSAAHTPVFSAS